jgi:hypothetical protein
MSSNETIRSDSNASGRLARVADSPVGYVISLNKQALSSNQASRTSLLGLLVYFVWRCLLARSIKLASSLLDIRCVREER